MDKRLRRLLCMLLGLVLLLGSFGTASAAGKRNRHDLLREEKVFRSTDQVIASAREASARFHFTVSHGEHGLSTLAADRFSHLDISHRADIKTALRVTHYVFLL